MKTLPCEKGATSWFTRAGSSASGEPETRFPESTEPKLNGVGSGWPFAPNCSPRKGPLGTRPPAVSRREVFLSLIHISEPTRQAESSYAVFCLKKKKKK